MGLGLAGMREAGDDVCGAGLLCQWAAALVWPRDGGGALGGYGKNTWEGEGLACGCFRWGKG
jgi:hypothetical protein